MDRRVVITGMGCVTPLGTSVDEVWQRLLRSESGVDYTTVFDASQFPTKFSAEVRDYDVSQDGLDSQLWGRRGRHTRFAARQRIGNRGQVNITVGDMVLPGCRR